MKQKERIERLIRHTYIDILSETGIKDREEIIHTVYNTVEAYMDVDESMLWLKLRTDQKLKWIRDTIHNYILIFNREVI